MNTTTTMDITDALQLARAGKRVRPIVWRDRVDRQGYWVEHRAPVFDGFEIMRTVKGGDPFPTCASLSRDEELLGEWECLP